MGSPEASIAQQNQQLKAEVQRWLSTSYLGETIYHRFTQTPPNLTTETDHFFNTASPGAAALYYHDTNHILIRESELSVNRPMEVCHEVLHYASFLGGGMDVRWRNGRGATSDAPVIIGDQRWFIEGLTDLHAHQLARAHQHTPTGVGYATEAAVGFYIQSVVGKETLRHAYVTGDYTAVRLAFDRRLGEGAFEQVVRSRTGRIALNRITELFRSAHIDYHQWDSDPFLSACINCMPSDDLRGFWRRD
jgi:hypothetical protein